MLDILELIPWDIIGEIVVFLLFVGYLVKVVIDILKSQGIVGEDQAGKVNRALSAFVGLLVWILNYMGWGEHIPAVEEFGLNVGTLVAMGIALFLSSKILHEIAKWVDGVIGGDDEESTGRPRLVDAVGGDGITAHPSSGRAAASMHLRPREPITVHGHVGPGGRVVAGPAR